MAPLDSIFCPKSIAVIGASRQPGSVGQSLLGNLLMSRYQGIIFPVNPSAAGVLGLKCYPSVLDIPDEVDLAVIIVPRQAVPQVLDECGRKGILGAVIISAGFKEVGGEGAELERRVTEIGLRRGISLVGPNCLGVINSDPGSSMNATFGTQMPKEGNIAFVSQSGALCIAVLDYAREARIGFSKFISMGNKAGVAENDLLRYLREDPKTSVILMYLEDLVDGREFMAIAREITSSRDRPKPIIALKAGRTLVGSRAASSHTGSLAGSDKVYDALFEQCGVIRVDTLEELFDYAKAFSNQPLPANENVAIVTNSGGPGVLAADSCAWNGLNVLPLGGATAESLAKSLPASVTVRNPLDLVAEAQAEQYEIALRTVLADEAMGAAVVILTPTAFTKVEDISRSIVRAAKEFHKPVAACLLGIYDVSGGIAILEENGIPNYRFPESAARALAELARFRGWLDRPKTEIKAYDVDRAAARAVIDMAARQGRRVLLEQEGYEVLRAFGFPVVKSRLASDEREAVAAAEELGFPVVMKISSTDILHKFDVGGVRLDLKDKTAVRRAYREIRESVLRLKPDAAIAGVMIEEMAAPGKEVILGMNRDPQFGPILMFGLGGIYVEVLEDVTFRLAPIREYSALAMINKTKTHKILDGFRGGPVYDIEAIADCLKRLSQLVVEFEEIRELDINPLLVYEKGRGCLIVDARLVIGNPATPGKAA